MTKDWIKDGPDAVTEEMIARAFESGFCQRSIVASEEHTCELCGKPIEAWTSYHITCSIEDDEPTFTMSHIYCPEVD